MVPDVRDHVIENGAKIRFVHLLCKRAENERRLAPSGLGDTLALDTTHLSAVQAADRRTRHWR